MRSDFLHASQLQTVALLRQARITPRRSAGQNFLLDPTVVETLVAAAGVTEGDRVLEIGPGLGAVTAALLFHGASVVAVELDRRLAASLAGRLAHESRLTVANADIRKFRRDEAVVDGQYKLVASLPFNVTSLVLRDFLEHPPRPSVLSLIVQKEVAERVTARPGRMSILSVAVQHFGEAELVSVVPRDRFFPPPEVDAAVLRIRPRPLPPVEETRRLMRLVRIGFAARRKMLHNTLRSGLRISAEMALKNLTDIGLSPACRAQDLTVAQWRRLAKKLL